MKKTTAVLAVSLALAGSGLASAQAAPSTPQTTEQSAQAKCSRYPASVITESRLKVRKDVVLRGNANAATVRVVAQNGTPNGDVKLSIEAKRGNDGATLVRRVSGGAAFFNFPSNLSLGRYVVSARFIAKRCSKFMSSDSDIESFKVVKR